MVQKSERKRGRPRAYDPDTAVARAMEAFWHAGFAATSLDDLSEATRMNRPSLYAAFGDKRAVYGKAFERYREIARVGMKEALDHERPLGEALRRFYQRALAFYLPDNAPPRGCFIISTAVPEALRDPEVRVALANGLREIDEVLEARIRYAQERGELSSDADPAALSKLASATLYYLAIRSRAGEPRRALEAAADAAVDAICGKPKPKKGGRR